MKELDMIRVPLEVLLLIAIYAGGAAVAVAALRQLGFDTRLGSDNRLVPAPLVVSGVANLGIAVVAILAIRRLLSTPALGLGVTPRSAITAGAALTAVLLASSLDAGRRGARPRAPRATTALLALLAALACGAWMEEVVFRAALLRTLAPVGIAIAVALSAVIFTAIHLPTARADRQSLLRWMVGGVALAVTYLVSGSVLVAAAVHLARNAGNVLLFDDSPVAAARWPAPPASGVRTLNAIAVSVVGVAITLVAYR
jgi:membrane protease YdiL (CAAX protease family)